MPRSTDILPSHYYHGHFCEMAAFVMRLYGHMLGDGERALIDGFSALGHDAQCVFVRLCNRKKAVFHRRDLRYDEIPDIDGALRELMAGGWVRTICEGDYEDALAQFSKPALLELFAGARPDDLRSSWAKPRLLAYVREKLAFDDFAARAGLTDYFAPARKDEVAFLLYLYFGRAGDGMTALALRDLGIAATNASNDFSARFDSIDEARAAFFYSQARRRLKTGGDAACRALAAEVERFPPADTNHVLTLRDELLHRLGQFHERCGETDQACAIYSRSSSFESRERLVRLRYAAGARDEAARLLEEMIADPPCDEAYHFAADFYARKYDRRRTGIFTTLLQSAGEISVDELYRGAPETAAISYFRKRGWRGYHVENSLWCSLFGLIFWDELFEHPGAMAGAFDFLPLCLRRRDFHMRHADAIRVRLARTADETILELRRTIEARTGTPNAIIGWYDDLEKTLCEFLSRAPWPAVTAMLTRLCEDYLGLSDGYPDLMLIHKDGRVKFVEIKAEGDQLRRNQLARLMQLRTAGFEAEICRVAYHVDPEQDYVVLDVETTGGRPPWDRVTEIGAVKIRNGRVVGEWQSLINPERPIPAFITELTGISNAMVADAPRFADIADELETFLDGAIFVAHNVNFDYGFIASEFRRTDRALRLPKFCTCAMMRRHYPGHASYGLKNLCRDHAIPLEDHHRALCDAKAAAELLLLINRKRTAPPLPLKKSA